MLLACSWGPGTEQQTPLLGRGGTQAHSCKGQISGEPAQLVADSFPFEPLLVNIPLLEVTGVCVPVRKKIEPDTPGLVAKLTKCEVTLDLERLPLRDEHVQEIPNSCSLSPSPLLPNVHTMVVAQRARHSYTLL